MNWMYTRDKTTSMWMKTFKRYKSYTKRIKTSRKER